MIDLKNNIMERIGKINYAIFLTFILLLFINPINAQQTVSTSDIAWSDFLRQHDLVWDEIIPDYYSGAIMGNGLLGNSIYKEENAYKFHIGRVDITEGRKPTDESLYDDLYHDARLPIGHFLLHTVGAVKSENMRLDLWDALTTGAFLTDKGKISFKSYVHATKDIIVLETETEGDEINFKWDWVASKAISPRYVFGSNDYPREYIENPNPEAKYYTEGNQNFSVQNLQGGKTFVVAWEEVKKAKTRRILITISHEATEKSAIAKAKTTIADIKNEKTSSLEKSHKKWWHSYYPTSFVSLGNAKMESFYWIQQYKLACLTRPDKYIIDLQGPWAIEKTPWPGIWWNLNVQLTYSPLFAANRADLSKPLWKSLNENIVNLQKNVLNDSWSDAIAIGRSSAQQLISPVKRKDNIMRYEPGNLIWTLFYYHQYCVYLKDEKELVGRFYPLLKKSVAYYEHIKEKRADGKYHLPETASPEYKSAKDCNYDLSLLRWGLNTLLSINETYKLNDPKTAEWTDFSNNLTDYPIDIEKGFMIGENVNLTSSHRHYSHLLMIYPLYSVNWEQVANRDIITKSISHWQSMPDYLQGYSFTGSASMYAMMGDGDKAVAQLQKFIDKYIQPNTLYRETGPVIETPLAGAASLQELLLQSWNDKIRVFPAVPNGWAQASFIDLRTENAFLISASRNNGKTVFIQVKSEKGGICRLQTNLDIDLMEIHNSKGKKVKYTIEDGGSGLIAFHTKIGETIRITNKSEETVFPSPVKHALTEQNPYGVRMKQ